MIGERYAKPTSEADLKAKVVELAHDMGYLVFSMPQAKRHARSVKSASGYPDLTIARNGRVLWFELKVDGGTMSEAQLRWARMLGHQVVVITPAGYAEGVVKRLLE